MTDRKKKLLVIQISLLLVGVLIIFLTYSKNISLVQEKTISTKTKKMTKNIKIRIMKVTFLKH